MASSVERGFNNAFDNIRNGLEILIKRVRQFGQVQISMLGFKGVGKSTLLWAMFTALDSIMRSAGSSGAASGFVPMKDPYAAKYLADTNELVVEAFEDKDPVTLELCPTASSDDLLRHEFEIRRIGAQRRWSRIRFCIADYPGSWLTRDAVADPEVQDLQSFIYGSHVLIVPVDVPSMTNDTWHRRTNHPEEIKNWIDNSVSSKRRVSPMLILLVPVRCEAELRKPDGAQSVLKLTRERYSSIIDGLKESPAGGHVAIAITPVQTFGTAAYCGQRDGADKRAYSPRFVADAIESTAQPVDAAQPLLFIITFLLNCRRLARNAAVSQIQQHLNWNEDLEKYLSALQKIRKDEQDGFEVVHDPMRLLTERRP